MKILQSQILRFIKEKGREPKLKELAQNVRRNASLFTSWKHTSTSTKVLRSSNVKRYYYYVFFEMIKLYFFPLFQCNAICKDERAFRKHQNEKCGKQRKIPWKCKHCKVVGSSENGFVKHMATWHKDKCDFSCPRCEEKFATGKLMIKHLRFIKFYFFKW